VNQICPSCQRPLLSGLSPLCSHCGAKVPAELLFSREEKTKIEAEEARAKNALAVVEKDYEQKRAIYRRKLNGRGGTGVAVVMLASSVHDSLAKKKA
jgi:hypothetical protein